MKILIIGDRKQFNMADVAYPTFTDLGHEFIYFHIGANIGIDESITAKEGILLAQLGQVVVDHRPDIMFFRADWFDNIFRFYAKDIFSIDWGIPKVFGYHCHMAKPNALESEIFSKADAFVLINEESRDYFKDVYGFNQQYFLLPSLIFPPKNYYNKPLRPKLSISDGKVHAVIPTRAIRLSGLPSRNKSNIPIDNFLLDRYDYYQIIRLVAGQEIHVHTYGGVFLEHLGRKSKKVESVYRQLEMNSSYVHFDEEEPEEDFAVAISQYDFAISTGFIPHQVVPAFDHMNYQARFNSIIAAGLPSFVAKGTSTAFERIIDRSGAGLVYESLSELKLKAIDHDFMSNAIQCVQGLREDHSFEKWAPELVDFFHKVLDTTQLQPVIINIPLQRQISGVAKYLFRKISSKILCIVKNIFNLVLV